MARLIAMLRQAALPAAACIALTFGASQAIGSAVSSAEPAALACPTENPFTGPCTGQEDCQTQCTVAFGENFVGICHDRQGEMCCVCIAVGD